MGVGGVPIRQMIISYHINMRYAISTHCDWERVVICNGNLLTCDMCYLGKKSQNKLIHPHCPQC